MSTNNEILICLLSICTSIFNINSGCCYKCNKYTSNEFINQTVIKITSNTITLNGEKLKKLENEDEMKCVVNEKYIYDTNIYICNNDLLDNDYKPLIEYSDGNPYIMALVKVRYTDDIEEKEEFETKSYILSYFDYRYDFKGLFEGCKLVIQIKILGSRNIENMHNMFYGCSALKELKLSNLNTNKVTNMSNMFYGCSSLKEINLFNFNTSKVTNMSCMFYKCSSLINLDLSSFNTSKVINMVSMFSGCSSLKELNLSTFKTNNVIDMKSMFRRCSSLINLDLSSFNTSKVINMVNMFRGCSSLFSLNISNFNTKNVIIMNSMFDGCNDLENININTTDKNIKRLLNIFNKRIKKVKK